VKGGRREREEERREREGKRKEERLIKDWFYSHKHVLPHTKKKISGRLLGSILQAVHTCEFKNKYLIRQYLEKILKWAIKTK
jgi:hypothetical protein